MNEEWNYSEKNNLQFMLRQLGKSSNVVGEWLELWNKMRGIYCVKKSKTRKTQQTILHERDLEIVFTDVLFKYHDVGVPYCGNLINKRLKRKCKQLRREHKKKREFQLYAERELAPHKKNGTPFRNKDS